VRNTFPDFLPWATIESIMDPSELRFFVYRKMAVDASRPLAVATDRVVVNQDTLDGASVGGLYAELVRNTTAIQKSLQALSLDDGILVLEPIVSKLLARMIYCSNRIDDVGGDWDATMHLCQPIFRSKKSTLDVYREELEYEALVDPCRQPRSTIVTPADIRREHEIIQHAKAAKYMLTEVYLHGHELSEEILLNTHRIMTYNIDSADGAPPTEYGGVYRSSSAPSQTSEQSASWFISQSVQHMIESLTTDLAGIEKDELLKAVSVASNYCHVFCNIRPFSEGNGRMGRLLLNAILLKTVGAVACLGNDTQSRESLKAVGDSVCGSPKREQVSPGKITATPHLHGPEALRSMVLKSVVESTRHLAKALRAETGIRYSNAA